MRSASLRLPAVLVVTLLLGESSAHAEFMQWSYHWSISPAPVFSGGTGTVALALGQPGRGSTKLLAAAMTTSSSATAQCTDHFNSSFNLSLHLTDLLTHKSGNLTFRGTITGTLTDSRASLVESFRVPAEHITISGHTYYVSLPSRLAMLPPGTAAIPYLYATVGVQNAWPPPIPPRVSAAATVTDAMIVRAASFQAAPASASTPEPSALVLAALGAALLSIVCISRFRLLVRLGLTRLRPL